MPNEWNKVIDGVISATSNVAQSLLAKDHRNDAEKAYRDFKKKLISSYLSFAKTQDPEPEALQALKAGRLSGNADNGQAMQPPALAEAQETPFEAFATYGQLLDFKNALNKNPLSNRYSADADNLFSLLFGRDFIKKNVTEKKFTPNELQNMSFDAAKAMNRRQVVENIMHLSEDVRNQLIQSNEFARNAYQRNSQIKRTVPGDHQSKATK